MCVYVYIYIYVYVNLLCIFSVVHAQEDLALGLELAHLVRGDAGEVETLHCVHSSSGCICICVYVYVCVYIYIYICVMLYVCIHIYIYIY